MHVISIYIDILDLFKFYFKKIIEDIFLWTEKKKFVLNILIIWSLKMFWEPAVWESFKAIYFLI